MSEIEITQADRGQAKRIVREFRQEGWPAKEEELAGLLSRFRHEARAEALEEAAFAAHGAIFDLALSDAGNGQNVTPAQYSEAAIDAIRALRSGEREG